MASCASSCTNQSPFTIMTQKSCTSLGKGNDYITAAASLINLRDGNIRYYEFETDEFWPLAEYKSSDPQRGVAFMPKRALSV